MMHVIPASWPHLHILVTVFPSVGLVFALGFYVAGIRTKNEALKRTCLLAFVLLGLLAVPTYMSGDNSMELIAKNPKASSDALDYHYGWGIAAVVASMVTGFFALINLFRFRSRPMSENATHLVLG